MRASLHLLGFLMLVGYVFGQDANFEPCSMTKGTDKASIVCTGAVGWVETSTGAAELRDAVKQLEATPIIELEFRDIAFTGDAFQEALEAVLQAGGSKAVDVTMTNCSMTRQVAYLGGEARIPGGASLLLVLKGCNFTRNQIVSTLLFGSNGDLNLNIALNGSELSSNQLIAVSGGLVRGLAGANVGLNDAVVADNQVFTMGALAISSDGTAAPSLRGSRLTGNMLQALGLAALGGGGKYTSKVETSEVAGNVVDAMGLYAEQQGLVKAVVGLIARLSFQDPSLNLTQIIGDIQGEICKVMPDDYAERDCGPLCDIAQAVRSLLCGSGAPSLGALVPVVQKFLEDLKNTAGASLGNLLARLGNIQSLLPLALPLLSVLQNLSLDTLLTPEVVQPILNLLLQLLAPQQ